MPGDSPHHSQCRGDLRAGTERTSEGRAAPNGHAPRTVYTLSHRPSERA
jgi:hypothetical protein